MRRSRLRCVGVMLSSDAMSRSEKRRKMSGSRLSSWRYRCCGVFV